MKIFEEMEQRGHEELIFNYVDDVDLKMIISLHDTTLGKTLGGVRMGEYDSDADAIEETLRLSQIMTYQSATADIDCGGGSVVLWGDRQNQKSEAYFRAVGRLIESLKGRIVVSPDLGTDSQDFKYIQRETENTIFRSQQEESSADSGDTFLSAEVTALGVYWGIKACAKSAFGSDDLSGRSFAVQGLGKVGRALVDCLKQENTSLAVTDIVYDNIKQVQDTYPDVQSVRPEEILYRECDFLVPCAVSSIIDREALNKLRCRVIAGSAYNIFTDEKLLDEVHGKGILYAPDFVISAGDLLLLDRNLKLGNLERAREETKIIYNYLLDLLYRSAQEKVPPYKLAMRDAMERYRKIDQIKNILC